MSTPLPTRRLFAGLLDDAAMFPPGNASPADAIAAHREHRQAWYADLIGPLLVPIGQWDDFLTAHRAAGSPTLEIVIIGSATIPAGSPAGLMPRGVEIVLPGDVATAASALAAAPVPVAAEIFRDADLVGSLATISMARAGQQAAIAKFRTGGTTPDAFPTEPELATSITAAVGTGVPFKLTAGLHHAVRHTAIGTGFEHHGVLNVLAATGRCLDGSGPTAITELLAERDPAHLTSTVRSWSAEHVTEIRISFRSFGCCGVTEPIDDLLDLGLISKEPA